MFSKIIKDLRKKKHVTQIQLAQAIGVSAGNVGDWETGKSLPSYNALIALSSYFGVSGDVLLGIRDVEIKPEDSRFLEGKEVELVNAMRTLDHRDRDDIYDLAEIKLRRMKS